jgi:hypothetical protein
MDWKWLKILHAKATEQRNAITLLKIIQRFLLLSGSLYEHFCFDVEATWSQNWRQLPKYNTEFLPQAENWPPLAFKLSFLLEYNATESGGSQATFRRNTSLPSSGLKGMSRSKTALCFLPASLWFLAWLTFQPWRWKGMILRNVGSLPVDYTALDRRKWKSSRPLKRETRILNFLRLE